MTKSVKKYPSGTKIVTTLDKTMNKLDKNCDQMGKNYDQFGQKLVDQVGQNCCKILSPIAAKIVTKSDKKKFDQVRQKWRPSGTNIVIKSDKNYEQVEQKL